MALESAQTLTRPHWNVTGRWVVFLGWLYHFSNGATFGVMYVAIIRDPFRRRWAWAVLLAVGLELGMLLTPYPQVFNIEVSTRFVIVRLRPTGFLG